MKIAPRVKVCCIQSFEEAALAIDYGASALGLVSAMPSGPGVIEESQIREIATSVPPGVATVLLTSSTEPDEIVNQQRRCRVNSIQLCDTQLKGAHARLRSELPGIAIIQVLHIADLRALEEAHRLAGEVDALLLDTGSPDADVKELGGTGRTHDWSVSRKIVDQVEIPVFLAGGLNPENVSRAIREVRPYGIDVCTGLRDEGRLDRGLLHGFMRSVIES